jgi:hypothetical protein
VDTSLRDHISASHFQRTRAEAMPRGNLITKTSFVSAFTLLACTLKCVRAAANGNPMKSLHTDQNVHPNLRHCQIHSMNHQSPAHRYVMRTILTNMSADAHSSCMQCYPARANITCMPIAKTVPKCASRNRALASHNSGAGAAYMGCQSAK